MKIFAIILSVTLILLGCGKDKDEVNNKAVDYGSLQARDGLVYIKDESRSFSGRAESRHENGELKSSITYKDGKKDGLVRSWYENGKMQMETTYKDGKKDGLTHSWSGSGQLKKEATYKDGKEDGLLRTWYESGQLKSETAYKDGKKVDLIRSWYESGQPQMEAVPSSKLIFIAPYFPSRSLFTSSISLFRVATL